VVGHERGSTDPSKTLIAYLPEFDMSMPEQRTSRRAFLASAAGVGVALAGCSSASGSASRGTGATNGSGSGPVSVLSAGSLELAFGEGLSEAVDTDLRVESHGSSTVARLVSEGQRDPDIVALADTALFDGPLHPSWYSVFASNAVVIAYNPNTEAGERLGEAGSENWYDVLLDEDVTLGRTDPTQDPLGYRALFTLELASRYYDDANDLRERVPERDQIYPETGLISQFESGNVDAAVAYRNMAVERDYDYIDLPDRIDLGNPKYEADWYSTVSYTAPSGKTTRGGLIGYGSTVRNVNPTTKAVFETLTTGDYLEAYGFEVPANYPETHGNPPSAFAE
jgi:molybdate/tungstate transport system substrate-binding protein